MLAIAAAAAACGSETATSVGGPSTARCGITLPASSGTVDAAGGIVTFSVATEPECQWSVSIEAAWLTQITPASRQGAGQVELRAAPNSGPARIGTARIEDRAFTVIQTRGCTFVVNPTSHVAPASGGPGEVQVTTGTGCDWVAIAHGDTTGWVTVTSGDSAVGSASMFFEVLPHDGPQRSGTMTVAGQVFTITQASGCTYSIAPLSQIFTREPNTGVIAVTAGAGCPWAASSGDPWIQVETRTGTGSGEVRYTIQLLTALFGRVGVVNVAGHEFHVVQLP